MSQRPVITISKRRLIVGGIVLLLMAALVAFARQGDAGDAAVLKPAQNIAQALATQDLYQHPDTYKSDLTWSAYQQVLAVAPQAQGTESLKFVKFGARWVYDRGVFGDNLTALVEVFVSKTNGKVLLREYHFQMVPNGSAWQVNQVITLERGEVNP
jgi:hypothetical protein